MISRNRILSFVVVALIACAFFLSFPETGNAQYLCWQSSPDSCNDNSGNGGGVVCNSAENVIPNASCNESEGLCTPVAKDVPTLSEWGPIAFAGILGMIGLIAIRRRKVNT